MEENITISEDKIRKATTTLATMLDYLGLEASVKSEIRNDRIALIAVSEDAGRIIGRKGKTLDDLQLLINKMMQKGDDSIPKITVDVEGYSKKPGFHGDGEGRRRGRDVRDGGRDGRDGRDGGRDGRQEDARERLDNRDGGHQRRRDRHSPGDDETIRQQALDASKEVKRWGEPVTLPPMNSHQRRIVHITLKDDDEIITESRETDNPNLKSVVISLKKQG